MRTVKWISIVFLILGGLYQIRSDTRVLNDGKDKLNKYSFGFSLGTGPCISVFNKNLVNTFLGDLLPTAREDGFGIFFGYKQYYLKYLSTKKTFSGGPIESLFGDDYLAEKQFISFYGRSLEIIYHKDIAYLKAGLDYYAIEERFEGLAGKYIELYDGVKRNKKIGGHLGFGLNYRNTKSKFIYEPFFGITFFYINGTCNGLKWDYYLRGGFRIEVGIYLGFRI